jgi:GR25 family glycosyltransferase involved in LPS biosynthesis
MHSVVVISIFDGNRSGTQDPSEPLAPYFPRLFVAPVLVNSNCEEGDARAFYAHSMTRLTPGVLGCALAHRQVATLLLESDYDWAIVLEDDAQVIDAALIARRAQSLSASVESTVPTLLLFAWDPKFQFASGRSGLVEGTSVCSFTPTSSVAYLINKGAAKMIVDRQTPVAYLADWPLLASEVVIMTDNAHPVRHADLPSTIDTQGRTQFMPLFWRTRILTLSWYLQHHNFFENFSHFLEYIFLPRFHVKFLRWRKKLFVFRSKISQFVGS